MPVSQSALPTARGLLERDGDEKDIKILHVDGHNLVYEIDGQTNSMKR